MGCRDDGIYAVLVKRGSAYQPEAHRLSVNGVDYPNVFGNVVSVACG